MKTEGVIETPPAQSHLSNVAFVVAAYNAAKHIEPCLEAIIRQSPCQIIVVNDGSTDQTEVLVRSFPEVELYNHSTNQGVATARNTAMKHLAEVDYVAFIDSDIVLSDNWLEELQQGCDWSVYSVACGLVIPADRRDHWAARLDDILTVRTAGSTAHELSPPWRDMVYFNYLFKRSVLEEVGEFDTRFRTNAEDSDYFYRCEQAGFRFWFDPLAQGLHCYPRPTFTSWLSKQKRNGYFTIQFHMKNQTPLLAGKRWRSFVLTPVLVGIMLAIPFSGVPWMYGLLGAALLAAGPLALAKFRVFSPHLGWVYLLGRLAKICGETSGLLAAACKKKS